MSQKDGDRLRPPASERLSFDEECFDLKSMAQKLRAEEHPAVRGHRQMTIFKKADVTTVLFTFEEEGNLKEHSANGIVHIQCVDGDLLVATEDERYELTSGQLVVLAPNIRHSVEARAQSIMLLTVNRC